MLSRDFPGCTIWPGSTWRTSTRASAGARTSACATRAQLALAQAATQVARDLRGSLGQCELRPRLRHIGASVGIGLDLRLRTLLLGPRHVYQAPGIVELRRAVEAFCNEFLRPRQAGIGRHQRSVGLRASRLRSAAATAAQARQTRLRLLLRSHCLRQGGSQLIGLQLDQHIALAYLRAFSHKHLRHPPSDGAAHVHARQRGHARGKLQGAHQRRGLHHERIHLRPAQRHRPDGSSAGQQGSAQCKGHPERIHRTVSKLANAMNVRGAISSGGSYSEKSPPAACGGATPRCR
jgi:hypothetical protein